jgi:hypothetical protein
MNRVTWNCFTGAWRSRALAARRRRARRGFSLGPHAVHTHRGRTASAVPCAAPSSPLCVTRAAPWSAPRGKSPLGGERHHQTPLDRRSCTSPRRVSPCRAVALTGSLQTASPLPEEALKSRRLPLARAHRAPPCAIEGPPPSVSSHLLSEPRHAPNAYSRPSRSSHACLLPRPRYPLAGARVPATSTAGLR